MRKLNFRESLILIITLVLAGVCLVYQFLIKPMSDGAMDIDGRLRKDQQRFIKASQMKDQKDLIEKRYQNLVSLVGVVDSEEDQMSMIVSKVEAAARESNIHIANIQPQKSNIQKEAMFLAVELEVDGSWLDIVHFLYLLQQQPNLYFINELNLEKYSDAADSLRGRIVVSRMSLVHP